jgi:hypothetical protein
MGRIKIADTYTCENCIHISESDCESCVGCHALSKDTMMPRGWEGMAKTIPTSFDATAFLRAMKDKPVTIFGVRNALKEMLDNLELQRLPYFTMTRVHMYLDNVPAVYVDDGHKSLVVMLNTDECGKCTGKLV